MKKIYFMLAALMVTATLSAETITLKMSNFQKTSLVHAVSPSQPPMEPVLRQRQ